MMSLETALQQDIRAHPQDDTPRLIYADWLEEQGTPAATDRAHFIRLQCRLAHLRENDPRRAELQSEADALLSKRRPEWTQPLRAIMPGLDNADVTFVRGFPLVTLHRLEDLEHAAGLASVAPQLHLDLFHQDIDDAGAQALAQSPHLQHLTHLNLIGNHIGDAGVQALTQSPYLSRLTHLYLGGNQIGEAGARALARSPQLGRLTHLDLFDNNIGDTGVQALAQCSRLQHLTHLDLFNNDIGAAGALALARSPHLPHLMHLNLIGNHIGAAGALALARSPHLPNLTHLDLLGNGIGAAIRRDIERVMDRRQAQVKSWTR